MSHHKAATFVRDRFSRSASRYAGLAFLQKEIAEEVAAGLVLSSGAKVLDVGTGTGFLLEGVHRKNKDACVVGLDASFEMVTAARSGCPEVPFVLGVAEHLPFKTASLDAVVSSSSYQWVKDLGRAFREGARVLKPGGIFQIAFFGQKTLHEFFDVLEDVLPSGAARPLRLASLEEARAAFAAAGFGDGGLSSQTREVTFRSVWALLQWLKAIGANSLAEKFFLGPKLLHRLENAYVSRYSNAEGVNVSFEIIGVKAKR